jgi:DNA (cytosine-5)-methyltransferase 1
LSLGFEQAGFDVVAAVEIDPIHCAVHEYNFPTCSVIPRSISTLTGAEIRDVAGLGKNKVDVVFGGAPCQGFSLIGHRALDDPRNGLVADFVRIVSELDANYFVFENVRGLTVGRHQRFLQELIQAFESKGYRVQMPWRVLDAADYGAPQHRERLILMGAKKRLKLPNYPEPSVCPADSKHMTRLPKGPSCLDALADLPDADLLEALWYSDEVLVPKWRKMGRYAEELRCLEKHHWHYGYPRKWNPSLLTSSSRTEHTEISRRRFSRTMSGEVEPISRFFKLSETGLSNTLRAGTDSSRGAFTSPRPIHYHYPRCVTVREMARLHGFPDWFRFHETKWHGARQIGNAVPPPLGRAVASRLVEAMGIAPKREKGRIELGQTSLLRMDMSAAAAYFDIPVPIGKRDRKSGATKRKQHEIEREHLVQEIPTMPLNFEGAALV